MRCLSRSSFCNDVEVPTNLFSTMEITTNPFIVMTKADFEAAIAQMATRLQPVQSINQPAPAAPNSQTVAADKQFLSRKETAELLKVDFSTLWRWNKSGILKSVKVGPRRVLYKYDDVMNILTLGGA